MKRLLLACLLFATAVPAFAQTAVTIVPTGADWVSKGVARTYTPSNATIQFDSTERNSIFVSVNANNGSWWNIRIQAPFGETLRPGPYYFAERWPFQHGRAPALDYSGDGAGCNQVFGTFAIRQILFDAAGQLVRLEANATHHCESDLSPAVGIGLVYRAPQLAFSIDAPDLNRTGRNYYGDTSTFSLVNASPAAFQYKASGQRDKWTMTFARFPGQSEWTPGVYLTEGAAAPGVAGMNIVLGSTRKTEFGKFEVLTVAYRNGAIVQLSARFWFYSDLARTKVVRSGRINFWK